MASDERRADDDERGDLEPASPHELGAPPRSDSVADAVSSLRPGRAVRRGRQARSQEAAGRRWVERTAHAATAIAGPHRAANPGLSVQAGRRGPGRSVGRGSISTSAHAVAACTSANPRTVSVVPIPTASEHERSSGLGLDVAFDGVRAAASTRPWRTVVTTAIGSSRTPIPRKSGSRRTYIAPRRGEDLAPRSVGAPAAAELPGATSRGSDREQKRTDQDSEGPASMSGGFWSSLTRTDGSPPRPRRRRIGRRRPRLPAGNGEGCAPPAFGPDRLGPRIFMFGPVGPLKNAAEAHPSGPGTRATGSGGYRAGRSERCDSGHGLTWGPFVSSQPTPCRRSCRGRAPRRRSSRASRRPGTRPGAPVDELELVIAPVRAFGTLVLAVADLDGRACSASSECRVEDELDRLPVALVQVVEVVEEVEEPVLKASFPGRSGSGATWA